MKLSEINKQQITIMTAIEEEQKDAPNYEAAEDSAHELMLEYIHKNMATLRETIQNAIDLFAENEAEVYVSTKLGLSSSDEDYIPKKNAFIELLNEEIRKTL